MLLGLSLVNQISNLPVNQLSHQERFAQREKQGVGVRLDNWSGAVDIQLDKSNNLVLGPY